MAMTHQKRQRALHAAVCALSLAAIVALTVRQTASHGGGRIVSQLTWLARGRKGGVNGSGGNGSEPDDVGNRTAAVALTTLPKSQQVFDPFNELAPNDTTTTATRIVYPQLYRSLTRLTQPPGTLVSVQISGPGKTGLPACRRPASKNLVGLLSLPPSRLPFKRPHRGGFWSPGETCWPPLSRTAVLVPYRNRTQNLELFIPYMQTLLQQQGIVYGIFVIEQANLKLFNRAKLLNIGFKVSQQFGPFDCFVFQDADKVPENVANVFECSNSPKLMMSEIRPHFGAKYVKGMYYHNFFGACVALSKPVFERINGNSNRYYGWGREDDELAARLSLRGGRIHYPGGGDARFVNLHHSQDIVSNSMPWPYAHKVRETMDKDGLNTLAYGDKGIYQHDLFTLIRADV